MTARLALLAVLFLTGCQQAGNLEIEQAWIRKAPPGARMLAAYATLTNGTSNPIELIGFSSPSFELVELHQTQVVDGVSQMRQVPSLVLEPGNAATLEPGGLHLMLMRPTESLDQQVTIHLETGTGERITGVFAVGRNPPGN